MVYSAVVALGFSFGSPTRYADGCYPTISRGVSKRILSKGAFVEIIWISQGLAWSCRTGKPTPTTVAVIIVSIGFLPSSKVEVN